MNRYTIHFLTQEEPESGDAEDRKILTQGCPSIGMMEFESNAENWQMLFQEFQHFMKDNCNSAILEKIHFPQLENRVDTI